MQSYLICPWVADFLPSPRPNPRFWPGGMTSLTYPWGNLQKIYNVSALFLDLPLGYVFLREIPPGVEGFPPYFTLSITKQKSVYLRFGDGTRRLRLVGTVQLSVHEAKKEGKGVLDSSSRSKLFASSDIQNLECRRGCFDI